MRGLERALPRVEHAAREGLKQTADKIAEDARARAPVDTGTLRASIATHEEGEIIEVVATADYAAYVEFGTQDASPEPFLRPAIQQARAKAPVTFGRRKL